MEGLMMDKREMEQLAFVITKELGTTKKDEELIESIRQNIILFKDVEKKIAPTLEGAKVRKSPY